VTAAGSQDWAVYLLRCADGTLYCGCTIDLDRRLDEHNTGKGAKYVCGRTPAVLIAARHGLSKSAAHRFEAQVKRLPSKRKKAFVKSGKIA
jgi:putative endonuclease